MKRCLSLALLILLLPGAAVADPVADGRAILESHCSRCHAIGPEGTSPHDKAPPFREVMKIYGAESLEEALGEGLVTGHPDMPEFVFAPEQVAAIEAYLKTLE